MFNIAGAWDRPDEDAANIEWARAAWADMKEFSSGGTYLNFLTEDDGEERTDAALGPALKRLEKIKGAFDPENVFQTNRNIRPRQATQSDPIPIPEGSVRPPADPTIHRRLDPGQGPGATKFAGLRASGGCPSCLKSDCMAAAARAW